jgi:serine phosphatase RsbU (regulator of sigma subunit)
MCMIAAVDCTGHGVPGAMMSMIANSLLNKIVIDKGIIAPDKVLNEMHLNIRQALKQDTTDSRDGMDMAICLYDKKQHKLVFAGARNSMYVLTDYEIVVENMECRQVKSENYILTEIKADKNPIGGFQHENQRIFTNHEIVLQRNKHTTFYLLSDGYEDQFGGGKDRKFSSRQLRELLLNIQTNDMETQHKIIKNTMENWQGKTKQIDDMLIVGVKV